MFFETLAKFMGKEYTFIFTVASFLVAVIGLLISIFKIENKTLKILLICFTSFVILICSVSTISYIVNTISNGSDGEDESSECQNGESTASDPISSDLPTSNYLYAKPSEDTDKWGYVDVNGIVIIPYSYDFADDFIDGYAAVCQHNKWGFIDASGKEVIPFEYDFAWSFINGLAPVFKDGLWGFIDERNNVKIPFKYTEIGRTYTGHEQVYLDESNKIINYEEELNNTNLTPEVSTSTNLSDTTVVSSTRIIETEDYLQPYVSATIDKSELHITINKELADQCNENNTYPFRWGVRLESDKTNDYVIDLELCIDLDGSIIETNVTVYIVTSPTAMKLVQDNLTQLYAYLDNDKYILSCDIANDYIPLDDMCINTFFLYQQTGVLERRT